MSHLPRSPRHLTAALLTAATLSGAVASTAFAADGLAAVGDPNAVPAATLAPDPKATLAPSAETKSVATITGRSVTVSAIGKPRRKKGDNLCGQTAHFFVVAGTSGGTSSADPFALYGLDLVKLSVEPTGGTCTVRGSFSLQRAPAAGATVAITLIDAVLEPITVVATTKR